MKIILILIFFVLAVTSQYKTSCVNEGQCSGYMMIETTDPYSSFIFYYNYDNNSVFIGTTPFNRTQYDNFVGCVLEHTTHCGTLLYYNTGNNYMALSNQLWPLLISTGQIFFSQSTMVLEYDELEMFMNSLTKTMSQIETCSCFVES